jgi:16S rRNA U516 pseudouridylate synthase RsuA-like enzyme
VVDGIRYQPMKVVVQKDHKKEALQKTKLRNLRRQGRHVNRQDMITTNKSRMMQIVSSTNHWIQITFTEGKNRQIRNVLKHLGCKCRTIFFVMHIVVFFVFSSTFCFDVLY